MGIFQDILAAIQAVDTTARKRQAGRTQTISKTITTAADIGRVVHYTATGAVLVQGGTIRSNGATTADFTKIAIYGSVGDVVELLSNADGILANLSANGSQLTLDFGPSGLFLQTGETIAYLSEGTGSTAVAFETALVYKAIADGAYLS